MYFLRGVGRAGGSHAILAAVLMCVATIGPVRSEVRCDAGTSCSGNKDSYTVASFGMVGSVFGGPNAIFAALFIRFGNNMFTFTLVS